MITKAQVIDLYLANKTETEKLLELMNEADADNPDYEKNFQHIQLHIKLIDLFVEALNREDPTQEELQHHFNRALSFGMEEN